MKRKSSSQERWIDKNKKPEKEKKPEDDKVEKQGEEKPKKENMQYFWRYFPGFFK